MNDKCSPEFAILTAMSHEHKPIMYIIDKNKEPIHDEKGNPHYLTYAQFGLYKVVVIDIVFGNNEAYTQTYQLLKRFPTIRAVIFVGVAGANKNAKYGSQVKISDVVIPARIKQLENIPGKIYSTPKKFRRCISELADSIDKDSSFYRAGLWETTISKFKKVENTGDKTTQAFNKQLEEPIKLGVEGTLATSDENKNREITSSDDFDFIDQEGYSVAKAASKLKRDFLIIRGIADRSLLNQEKASSTAAAVCGLFLGKIGSDGFISPKMRDAGSDKYDPLQSLPWKENPYQIPLVIPYMFLANRKWRKHWPPRAFLIALLYDTVHLRIESERLCLEVKYPDDPYCIFNVAGKDFLYYKYPPKNYYSIEGKARKFFEHQKDTELPLSEAPLRWASAGALVVATYKHRRWIMLFYRDIHPKGWNIANGGSHDKKEWQDIDWLANRECTEETILIKECITKETRSCTFIALRILSNNLEWQVEADKFTCDFLKLRRRDNLIIEKHPDVADSHKIPQLGTRYKISGVSTVEPIAAHQIRVNNELKPNFVFSLNMREHGIEAIKIFELNMDEAEANYVLNGEIIEDQSRLLKTPVMLLSLNYLNKIMPKLVENSPIDAESFEDCKILPGIPFGRKAREGDDYKDCDFILFDYDVRNNRDKSIRDGFTEIINEGKIASPEFKTLCPVTWKTLQMCLEQNIIHEDAP